MYGNQPLSKFGCKNQFNNWCCGHYLSNQVLVKTVLRFLLFLTVLPLAGLSSAEPATTGQVNKKPAYYTWVDAQGVMHNTLINPEKSSDTSSEKEVVPESKEIDGVAYLTEEEHQKAAQEKLADKKPFFTWTDGQGIIRSEIKPDVLVDFVAEEIIYDAVFAPPFRLPDYVMQGQCCENYAEAFTSIVKLNGSASYQVDDTLFPFQTQFGQVSASYFSLPKLAAKEILLLKGYNLPVESTFEIIALDKSFKPLYLASELKGLFVDQTWKDIAYKKAMLEISDSDVEFLIVFVQSAASSTKKQALSDYRLSVVRDQLLD